jgi:NTE family protein
MAPDGVVPLAPYLCYLDSFTRGSWPRRTLWLPTVCRRTMRRVVFGRNDLLAPLSAAVAASCAIPGYMAPVRIGHDRYVDGGVHSPTNADVLRREQLDLAIVLSPMSAERVSGFGTEAAFRRYADHLLRAEVRRLQGAGTRVAVLAPGRGTLRYMGADFMSDEHLVEIVRESFLDTGRQLLRPRNRDVFTPLSRQLRLAA